jgi:hypothetical protein
LTSSSVKELTAVHCDAMLLFVQAPVNVQDVANGRTRSKENSDFNIFVVALWAMVQRDQ